MSPARNAWLKLHLYLALGIGFLFVLMGLSGSLSVYREELDELLNPRLVIEEPKGEYLPLDRIMAALRVAHPNRYGAWILEMPRSRQGMITAWYEQPHETVGEFYAPLMVSVNPYTAEIAANRFWGRTATTWIYDLHTQLQLGLFGWNTVGILGLLLIVSASTGLYLWWPGLSRIHRAFAIRHDAGLARLAFDLHRALGLFSAIVLLLLAFTGFHLAYPKMLETILGASDMGHGDEGPEILSTAAPNARPVSLAEAVLVARGPFPHAEVRRVATPTGETGTYRINLRQRGEANIKHPATMVWVDRWSGQIREVRNPNTFSGGQTFISRIWPWHTGEAFGAMGRFLWFCVGLMPLVLYVTGLLHWLHRRGSIKDREVNLAALRPRLERAQSVFLRQSADLLRLIRLLAGWALVRMMRLAQWGKRRYLD
ncbi:PepSY-associated TM helix domain-containing protein [Methylocaldum sp.]|uniref:PepSY-associated TM helix domain-containing protein n=1 Tax=Methylocaldum sp. TaxID=1969727 RepID=UPI002D2EDF3E|nr:PepSY-associated TM helix domain-containing protein [Methylocaldum sp.]HYE36094.1 PepSY-associated TM helix domain-containing protein [Methylocaldum sp.]